MGDRTNVEIRFREKDREAVIHAFVYEADTYANDEGIVEAYWYDMNGGACDEQQELVKMGIVFAGNHGPGSEYMPMAFAHDGTTFVEVCVDFGGTPVCQVVNGEIEKEGLAEIRKYEKICSNVDAIFKAEDEK